MSLLDKMADKVYRALTAPTSDPENLDESYGPPRALTDDDLSDFELAAQDRPPTSSTGAPRGPAEVREVAATRPTRRRALVGSTKKARAALTTNKPDEWRVRVLRGHIEWVKKMCDKNGIDYREVSLWEL